MQESFEFETRKGEMYDITAKVEEIVESSGVREGIVNVFAPHATGVLFIGEFEPNLCEDYRKLLSDVVREDEGWKHNLIDDNATAHLRSALVGCSLSIPVRDSKMLLGTWQRIIFFENDRNRIRRIVVTVVGD